MLECDTLVIGGGVSGSAASLLLSKMGNKVITIDKGINLKEARMDITESTIPFGYNIQDLLKQLEIEPSNKFNKSIWKSRNEVFYLQSDVLDLYFKRGSIENSLDLSLIKKAENLGCRVFDQANIKEIGMVNGKVNNVKIKTACDEFDIKPQYVIGADGAFSSFRVHLGIKLIDFEELEGYGLLYQGQGEGNTEIVFDSKFARGGYIYHGGINEQKVIGVVIDKASFKSSAKQVFELNQQHNRYFKTIAMEKIDNYFGGNGVVGVLDRITQGNSLLIGQAGLLVDPFIGYGVNYALFSAFKAAKTIDECLKGKEKGLQNYELMYQNQIVPYFIESLKARRRFRCLHDKDFDYLLKALRTIQYDNSTISSIFKALKAKPSSIKALLVLLSFNRMFKQ